MLHKSIFWKTSDLSSNDWLHIQAVFAYVDIVSHGPGAGNVTMATKVRKANKQRFEVKNHYRCERRVRPGSVQSSPLVAKAHEFDDLRRHPVRARLKWVLYAHCQRDYIVGTGLQRLKDQVKTQRTQ